MDYRELNASWFSSPSPGEFLYGTPQQSWVAQLQVSDGPDRGLHHKNMFFNTSAHDYQIYKAQTHKVKVVPVLR
jgi:hypothetical protein